MHWHFWSIQIPFSLQSTFVLHVNSENIIIQIFKLCKAISNETDFYCLPEQSAKLSQLGLHWQAPNSSQNPFGLWQSSSVEQE